MTDRDPAGVIGELVHFRGHITLASAPTPFAFAFVTQYGQEVTITEGMYEASRNQKGETWLDLVDDEEAQTERWGHVMLRRGPWPEGEVRVRHGSTPWSEQRRAALEEALNLANPEDRHAAVRSVEARYGPALQTSRTIRTYGEPR